MTDTSTHASPPAAAKRAPRPDVQPVLERLAALHPALFGAVFLPLKRGIFQDLLAAHPDIFEREALKAALVANAGKPAILNVNIGTTVKGAVDDLDRVLAVLKVRTLIYHVTLYSIDC